MHQVVEVVRWFNLGFCSASIDAQGIAVIAAELLANEKLRGTAAPSANR